MLRKIACAFVTASVVFTASAAQAQETKDIVEVAVSAGQFKTLAAALTAADLVPVLKGKGPFTVFAPTDEAFAKLPKGTVEALLMDKAKLTAILTYHVVPGVVKAADVVKLDSAKTVQGEKVAIAVKDGKVTVNGANVVKTDIEASNGVIHVIDAVILPPTKSSQAEPQAPAHETPVAATAAAQPCHATTAATDVVRRQPTFRLFGVRSR